MNEIEELKSQILTIRDTGFVNMFALRDVSFLAESYNFQELVEFLKENSEDYCNFIISGDEAFLRKSSD